MVTVSPWDIFPPGQRQQGADLMSFLQTIEQTCVVSDMGYPEGFNQEFPEICKKYEINMAENMKKYENDMNFGPESVEMAGEVRTFENKLF